MLVGVSAAFKACAFGDACRCLKYACSDMDQVSWPAQDMGIAVADRFIVRTVVLGVRDDMTLRLRRIYFNETLLVITMTRV